MRDFYTQLLCNGVNPPHIVPLFAAIASLNEVLADMSDAELVKFTDRKGVLGNLKAFAECTEKPNVADRIYSLALDQAYANINKEEFVTFSDSLFPFIAEAATCKIPGAEMLCRSMAELRLRFEKDQAKLLPLRRRVVRLAELDADPEEKSIYSLKMKLTDKYVGTHSYLDEWQQFGKIVFINSRQHKNNEYETGSQTMIVQVLPFEEVTEEQIHKCLHDVFTSRGCSHEYDCCGCKSQTVSKVYHLYDGFYLIKAGWYLNI